MIESSSVGRSRRPLVAIFALAVLYYAVGKLGLLLAIPPGYATPIWLPAGVALVGILLYGETLWPGVALGSFAVNLATSFAADSSGALLRSLALPAAIAAGATLQAVVAARLVRHFVGFPNPLIRPRSIFGFLLLGGPLGCLVNPTIGALGMVAFGVLPGSELLGTWGTWWVGDTLGVLIGAPVALCLSSRETIWRKRRTTVVLPLCVLLLATVFGLVRVRDWHRSLEQKDLSEAALQTTLVLEQDFERYQELLLAMRRFFEASPGITRQGFHDFVHAPLERLPGIQSLAWSPRLAAEARPALVAATRAAGFSDFELTELDAAGHLVPAGPRAEYYPAIFLEPFRGNERSLGFDLASEAERRQTLERARDTAALTASGRIRLVQQAGEQWGFLIAVPVYAAGRPEEIAARRATLRGFVIGTFRVGDMLDASLRKGPARPLSLEIIDAGAPLDRELLYPFAAGALVTKAATNLDVETRYAMGGRSWRLVFRPTPEFLARQQPWQVWVFLVLALALVGLVGAVLLVTTGEAASIAQLVDERTVELRRAEEASRSQSQLLETVLDSIAEGVVVADETGRFVHFNAAAREIAGRGPLAVAPSAWPERYGLFTLDGTRRLDTEEVPLVKALRGENVDGAEFLLVSEDRPEGGLLEATARPLIDPDGARRGGVVVFRDVTARRRTQEALRESEERYRHLIESSSGLICTHDLAGVLTSVNAAAAAALGYAPEEMIGRSVQDFLHPEARPRFAEYLDRIARQGEDDGIVRWRTADGREMHWQHRNRLLRRERGSPYVLGVAVDVTEQVRDTADAVHRAHHDALTGLPNRYLFRERLERATALASREALAFAVMFLDLDGLKRLNDRLGHAAGDYALREVGKRLDAIVRRSDTACRYAGDEFALLLLGAQRAADAERVAAHIQSSLAEPAEYQGQKLDLAMSVGIALYPVHGTDPEALLQSADAAMYTAKRRGGGQFAFPPEAPVPVDPA